MYTFCDDDRYQLQSNETGHIHLAAGFGLDSSFIPTLCTVATKSKACVKVTVGGGAWRSARKPL